MKLNHFISLRSKTGKIKYRTLNIDENLHLFLKRTANHYNMPLSDLVNNILSVWKEEHEEEIKIKMTNNPLDDR